MDLDATLISAVLRAKNPKLLKKVNPEFLDTAWKDVHAFIVKFFQKNARLPRPETVEGKFAVTLPPAPENVGHYAEEIRSRAMTTMMADAIRGNVADSLAQGNPEAALSSLKELIQKTTAFETVDASAEAYRSLNADVARRLNDYKERHEKGGILGLETPWKSLTYVTRGFRKKDLIAVISRPEIGKTWFAGLCADCVCQHGGNVLFISSEMEPDEILLRQDAIGARVSADRFETGDLHTDEKDRLLAWYNRQRKGDGVGEFNVYGPGEITGAFDVELKIREHKPDFVVWDSFYLCSKSQEWQDMAQLVVDCDHITHRCGIPMMIVTQFTSTVRKLDKKADLADTAFTQAVARTCDLIIAMFRTLDMEDMNEMLIRTLKTRKGLRLKEMTIRWDLDTMNFPEVAAYYGNKATGQSFDNEDFSEKKGKGK